MLNIFREAEAVFGITFGKISDWGLVDIDNDIIPVIDEISRKRNNRAEYRVTEEYVRGANQVDLNRSLDPILTSLESKPIAEAYQDLSTIAANTLSTENIAALSEEIQRVVNINNINLAKLEDNMRTVLAPDNIDKIREIVFNTEDLSNAEKKKILVKHFQDEGNVVFKDKLGRRRTPARTAETIIRTETANVYNTGTINRGLEVGITRYIRDESVDCCPDICEEKIGDVRDVLVSPDPPYLSLHPNCGGTRVPDYNQITG